MLFVWGKQCACIISLPVSKSSVVPKACSHVLHADVFLSAVACYSGTACITLYWAHTSHQMRLLRKCYSLFSAAHFDVLGRAY